MALHGINLLNSYNNKRKMGPLEYDKVIICALPGSGKTHCARALNGDFSNANVDARVLDLDFKINNHSQHQVDNITRFVNTAMLDDNELDVIFTFPHMLDFNKLSLDINVCVVIPENVWELVARVAIRCAGGKLPYAIISKLYGNLSQPFTLGDYEDFLGKVPYFRESDCRCMANLLRLAGYDTRFLDRYCDHALEWVEDWKRIVDDCSNPNVLCVTLPRRKFLADCFIKVKEDEAHE